MRGKGKFAVFLARFVGRDAIRAHNIVPPAITVGLSDVVSRFTADCAKPYNDRRVRAQNDGFADI